MAREQKKEPIGVPKGKLLSMFIEFANLFTQFATLISVSAESGIFVIPWKWVGQKSFRNFWPIRAVRKSYGASLMQLLTGSLAHC